MTSSHDCHVIITGVGNGVKEGSVHYSTCVSWSIEGREGGSVW